MTDSSISRALRARFDAFRNDPTQQDSLEAAYELKGAAKLALDVANLAADHELKEQAQHVLGWLVEYEDKSQAEYDAQHKQMYAALDAEQQIKRDTHKLIQAFIGMEFEDHRWLSLIEAYKAEFPTFLVANSVWDRISPKSLSRGLRNSLGDLIASKRLGRVPTISELNTLRPEIMLMLEANTLRYLEKALPGFNFADQLSRLAPTR